MQTCSSDKRIRFYIQGSAISTTEDTHYYSLDLSRLTLGMNIIVSLYVNEEKR
jgi:hypothetical protein